MFARLSTNDSNYLRVITYINVKLIKLYFLLRKNIFNHWDISLVSFFNHNIMCFIINIYSDNQQTALKYLKDTEVNLNNVLIIIGNFNIRDNDWDLLYSHHSLHMDTLWEVANGFGVKLLTPINSIHTQYVDNSQDLNSVLDSMFLWIELEEFNNHLILPDL